MDVAEALANAEYNDDVFSESVSYYVVVFAEV